MPAKMWRPKFDAPRLLFVEQNGQPTKIRRYLVFDQVTAPSALGVYNNTTRTVERALLERYFMVKVGTGFVPVVLPIRQIFRNQEFLDFADKLIQCTKPYATVLSDAQTVALYTGPKRKLYQNALVSLSRVAINKRDSSIRQFPKFEKQDLTKAPRIINPRSPRYNLEAGRFLKSLEKPIYKSINKAWKSVSGHTVIKGLNCFQSAAELRTKWERFVNPVAIPLDATKWDAHVSLDALRFEHSVYNGIFGDKLLKQLLKWQEVNRGKAYCDDGSVEFIIEGTRASGDINTSMGNCIIACALLWVYCHLIGITAELANNGDDCVIICEMSDLTRFMAGVEQFYIQCGFRIEVEPPTTDFERIEFCQTRPMFDGERWRMVRNPLACLRKDLMCLIPMNSSKTLRKWLGAVGECGLSAASGVPVLQAWYAMIKRSGSTCSRRFKNHIFAHTLYSTSFTDGLAPVQSPVTSAARVSFYYSTGLTCDMQLAYEKLFDSTTLSTSIVEMSRTAAVHTGVPIITLAPTIFDN